MSEFLIMPKNFVIFVPVLKNKREVRCSSLEKHRDYSSFVCKVSKNVLVSVLNISASEPKLKVSVSSQT